MREKHADTEGLAADTPAEMTETSPHYAVSFNAERTARYHAARRGFFEKVHRWTLFVVVALGTAGVSTALAAYSPAVSAGLLGGITAILGAMNLAFDPAGRARTHETLQRRAHEIGAQIERAVDPTEAQCAEWRAMLHEIYADEPPPMRALDAVAYNATLAGRRENPDADMLVITLWQSLTKQWLSFNNAAFPRRSEIAKA